MKIRNPFFDLAKGLAVILMIQVHLTELFARQDIVETTIGKVSLFLGGIPVAPVFLFIMGYFLASSRKNTKETVIKGVKLFILGLLLNLGLNAHLLYKIFANGVNLNPWNYIFGIDLLIFAGVAIISIAIIKNILKNNIILFIITSILAACATSVLPELKPDNVLGLYFYSLFWGKTTWSYFPVFPWIAYPLAGYTIQLVKEKVTIKKTIVLASGLLSIFPLMLTAQFGISSSINLKQYYHHGFYFFIWSLFFILMWFSALWLFEHNFPDLLVMKYFKWVGKNVTAFYVVQWLLIGNIATAIFKTISLTGLALWFSAILVMTSVLVLLFNKIQL